MIVPFIFENEIYINEKPSYLWVFYKFLNLAYNNNIPIIAEEDYFIKPSIYIKKGHSASNVIDFYEIDDQKVENVKKYVITKEEKNNILKKYNNDEDAWINIIKNNDSDLEDLIEKIIIELENKYEKIECFIVWTYFKSLETVCKKHNIKILNMEGSAIRQPFYNELLDYFQFQNKYDSTGLLKKYNHFKNKSNELLILSREEILALFLEDKNLNYISKLKDESKYDVGYALGIKTDCFSKVYSKINQKEILDELRFLTSSDKISIRPHPKEPFDLSNYDYCVDKSNSSFEWMLNCKNIICDLSNVGFEALLLGKNLISLSEIMPSSFEKRDSLKKLPDNNCDILKVNFLAFYFFAPENLTNDYTYIKYRLYNDDIIEIYNKHLEFILNERGTSIEELKCISEKDRLKFILKLRDKNGNDNIDIHKYDINIYELKKVILHLTNDINKLKNDNEEIIRKNNILNSKISNLYDSNSWKITKPLRFILRNIKKIKKHKINGLNNKDENKNEYTNDYKNYPIYTCDYQNNIDFSNNKTDIKVLTFYLPQYHTFKENDEWWGKGFMEWVNTKKSLPRFDGHYQPREPHEDIGYYKLDNIETIKKQVLLAKQHGIYGFCFYYYWFSGKRLMEKPVDLLLKSNINYPFCLCWANENWTRAWDGQNKDILIKQDYSKQDYKKFIQDIKKYINDDRYIKIDNKPLIMIYNPYEIPNFKELTFMWRKYAREEGIGEIYIASKCDLANSEYKYTEFVDAEFDFPPQGIGHPETKITGLNSSKVFNYGRIVDDIEHLYRNHFPLKPFYYSCTMGWDNSPRRKDEYTVYYNYSLEKYYKWLRIIIEETRRRNNPDNRFMFVNAWNEWAEGTYLEPDEKYGYANINTLSKAIFDLPFEDNSK